MLRFAVVSARTAAAVLYMYNVLARNELGAKTTPAFVEEKNETPPRPDAISLRQRATPFIDMLRRCEKDGTEIVWGV